jgi:biotin-dependent carboxylase-like uncharacterized protein
VTLEVLEPGLLTTVQDGGRPGLGPIGVPVGGAVDRWSMAVANRLLGNPYHAAVLEMTLVGPVLRAGVAVTIAIAGADVGATVLPAGLPAGRSVRPGTTVRLAAGDVVSFPGPAMDGARAYLALPGGIDVPEALGSRATVLGSSFGGLAGRALRVGDRVAWRASSNPFGDASPGGGAWSPEPAPTLRWPGPLQAGDVDPELSDAGSVRVLPGPAAVRSGDRDLAALLATNWTVSPDSDRTGLRLLGQPLRGGPGPVAGELASHGVTWGAIQVPPDGLPIVLLADHQPTGGYPVVAAVIAADHPRLGQRRPGDALRFVLTDVTGAVRVLRRQADALAEADRRLHDDARWEELWHRAGA